MRADRSIKLATLAVPTELRLSKRLVLVKSVPTASVFTRDASIANTFVSPGANVPTSQKENPGWLGSIGPALTATPSRKERGSPSPSVDGN